MGVFTYATAGGRRVRVTGNGCSLRSGVVQERLDAELAERTAAEQQAKALKEAADSESAAALEGMRQALADAQQDAEQAQEQLEARRQEVGAPEAAAGCVRRACQPVSWQSCQACHTSLQNPDPFPDLHPHT